MSIIPVIFGRLLIVDTLNFEGGLRVRHLVRGSGSWFAVARDSAGASWLVKFSPDGRILKRRKLPFTGCLRWLQLAESLLVLTPQWSQAFVYDTALEPVDSICLKTRCGCKKNAILDPEILLTKDGKLLCVGRYHVGNERYALAHLWDREGNFLKPLALFDSTWTTEQVALSPVSPRLNGDTLAVWSVGERRVFLINLKNGSLINTLSLPLPPWASVNMAVPLRRWLLVNYSRELRDTVRNKIKFTGKRWALVSYSGEVLEGGEGWLPWVLGVLPGDTLVISKEGALFLAIWR